MHRFIGSNNASGSNNTSVLYHLGTVELELNYLSDLDLRFPITLFASCEVVQEAIASWVRRCGINLPRPNVSQRRCAFRGHQVLGSQASGIRHQDPNKVLLV